MCDSSNSTDELLPEATFPACRVPVPTLLQTAIRTEEGFVGPGDDMRRSRRDAPVAAGAGVGLVASAQVTHGEIGSPRAGLSARHRAQPPHVEGTVSSAVRTFGAASCHGPTLSLSPGSGRTKAMKGSGARAD